MAMKKSDLATIDTQAIQIHGHRQYIAAATADNTRKTYRSAIRRVQKWGLKLPCDAHALINYLVDNAPSLNPRSLSLHLSAIRQWHLTQRFDDPTQSLEVKKTLQGITRTHGKPKQKAKALRLEHIATLLNTLEQKPLSNKVIRDKAMILIGFFGGFRRSELAAIACEEIEWTEDGITITLPQSKTDQEAQGPLRPVLFLGPLIVGIIYTASH